MQTTESNTIEYKQEFSDTILKDVIGFLNYSLGGHIYVGVDNVGVVYGVEKPDETQLRIINMLRDSIQPSVLGLFDVLIEQVEGKTVLHIIISSGNEKPYYNKSKGMSPKGCFIRVGTSVQEMTEGQIADLYSRRTRDTLKNIVSPHQDLTFEQLRIYYQEKGLSLNGNFAKNLDLLTADGKYNYAAYLLADRNATSIKVAKYSGTDKQNLTEYREYGYCSLIKSTKSVLEKLDIENTVSTEITYTGRNDVPLWNTRAAKEAVVNFIVHNDYTREVPPLFEIYSDRLEITSYGGLVTGLSRDEFFSGVSMPRNRELMRIFKDLELVEHIGSGMDKILSAYNPSVFTFMEHFLRVTFPFEKNREKNREKNTDIILSLIRENPNVTIADLTCTTKLSHSTVEKAIKQLKQEKRLLREGPDKGGYWVVL